MSETVKDSTKLLAFALHYLCGRGTDLSRSLTLQIHGNLVASFVLWVCLLESIGSVGPVGANFVIKCLHGISPLHHSPSPTFNWCIVGLVIKFCYAAYFSAYLSGFITRSTRCLKRLNLLEVA